MSTIDSHNEAMAKAMAELERCGKDAERYRWLRTLSPHKLARIRADLMDHPGMGFDAAIDAAMIADTSVMPVIGMGTET